MTDKLRQAAERGRQAEALLSNPLFVEAFDTVERSLHETWAETKGDQAMIREDAWRSLRLLAHIRTAIGKHVRTGKLAKDEIEQLARAEKPRRFLRP